MESSVAAVSAWLRACSQEFDRRVEELNELDRILGDGDHGTNMQRGFAAAGALDFGAQATAADALRQVGMALVKVVGGASGPLFGTFLLRTGATWPTPDRSIGVIDPGAVSMSIIVSTGAHHLG